mmetsp:Transcript_56209/g.137842  ORF Transcript_56209/g.137842 Transcript_56209/m.137842 type:complete len:294 (+) Transcript_56209:421-1302(+)
MIINLHVDADCMPGWAGPCSPILLSFETAHPTRQHACPNRVRWGAANTSINITLLLDKLPGYEDCANLVHCAVACLEGQDLDAALPQLVEKDHTPRQRCHRTHLVQFLERDVLFDEVRQHERPPRLHVPPQLLHFCHCLVRAHDDVHRNKQRGVLLAHPVLVLVSTVYQEPCCRSLTPVLWDPVDEVRDEGLEDVGVRLLLQDVHDALPGVGDPADEEHSHGTDCAAWEEELHIKAGADEADQQRASERLEEELGGVDHPLLRRAGGGGEPAPPACGSGLAGPSRGQGCLQRG